MVNYLTILCTFCSFLTLLLNLQSPSVPKDPVKPTDPQSPTLLSFEQDRKTEFDPIASGQTSTSGGSLLSELSSLEAPTQSSSASLLLPTQTTPLVPTQANSSSAFGLTADLAPPISAGVAYSIGHTSGIGMNAGGMGMGLHTAGSMGTGTGGMSIGTGSSGIQVLSEAFWWCHF